MFDPHNIKKDFPILRRKQNGKLIIYLDNAATTQKPQAVIDALVRYYTEINANPHRGIYALSEKATEAYEKTRAETAKFIGAKKPAEIVFTHNATESINLVAYAWGRAHIQKDDAIMVTELEHHSNLIPWQRLAQEKNAILHVLPVDSEGNLDFAKLDKFLTKKTKLVCVTQMSNVLGTIVPVEKLIREAHRIGAKVLIDGAQNVSHFPVDVAKLDCDFFVFSAHKMLGPTGVGILYAKEKILKKMDPFLTGGDMVLEVKKHSARWNEIPWKFEAGTPNVADVVAFQAALKYIEKLGRKNIAAHNKKLYIYARKELQKIPGITLYGPSDTKKASAIISFNVDGIHPHDLASILDAEGVCIRSGKHCAEPLIKKFNVPATARMSFYIYNTKEDIDIATQTIKKAQAIFKKPHHGSLR